MPGFVGPRIPGGAPPRTHLGTGLVLAREGVALPPQNIVPGEVTGVTPTAPGFNAAGAQWNAAENATAYRWDGRLEGQTEWEVWYTGPALAAAKTPLSAGSYEARVVALNGTVEGPPSAIMLITVANPPVTGMLTGLELAGPVPSLPVSLRVHAWEATTNPPVTVYQGFGPGQVPAGYRVRLRKSDGIEIPVQQDHDAAPWPDSSMTVRTNETPGFDR